MIIIMVMMMNYHQNENYKYIGGYQKDSNDIETISTTMMTMIMCILKVNMCDFDDNANLEDHYSKTG